MFDSDADPVAGPRAGEDGCVGLLDHEPTAEEVAFLDALEAAETASLNAVEQPVSPWVATETLAGRARTAEVLTRKAQAVGLRETHGLFVQVLADDAAYWGGMRPEAAEFAADEIASALGVSRRTAQIRIDDALDLVGCPRTLALLETGVLAYPVARALAHETGRAPVELREPVESVVLDVLGGDDIEALGSLSSEQIAMVEALRPGAAWRVGQAATRPRVIRLVRQAITDLSVQLTDPEPSATPVDVEAYPPVLGGWCSARRSARPTERSRWPTSTRWPEP